METIKVITRTDAAGTLRLELPTDLADQDVEVIVVLQPRSSSAYGWPADFFAAMDAIEADDLIERPAQGEFDKRESFE